MDNSDAKNFIIKTILFSVCSIGVHQYFWINTASNSIFWFLHTTEFIDYLRWIFHGIKNPFKGEY